MAPQRMRSSTLHAASLNFPIRNQIFNVKQTIAFLSQATTLEPGTLIMTGTPAGVGQVFTLVVIFASKRR